MPSAKTTLTNCYTPSVATPLSHRISPSRRPCGDGKSNETRSAKAIRRLCLDRSILTSSTGSSLVELGHTKVLCSVHGPRPATSSSLSTGKEFHSSGVLNCELRFAPTFGMRPETKVLTTATNLDGYSASSSGGTSDQEVELSSRLHDAISPSIPLDLLMKSVVDVFVMVLQDDGSVFAASTIAASMALSDAGVEVYDMVTACSVAIIPRGIGSLVVEDKDGDEDKSGISSSDSKFCLLADPVEDEIMAAEGVVTLAMMSNWKEVTFWDQTGRLPPKVASEAAELCRDGCTVMSKFMRQCLTGDSTQSKK
jgi:exosome complex component MTR3